MRGRTRISACMIVAVALFSVAHIPARAAAQTSSLDAYVSNGLSAPERDYMRHQMRQLPADLRARFAARDPSKVTVAIIDGVTSLVHYNHEEDIGSVVASAPPPDLESRSAQCPPPSTSGGVYDPGCYAKSGPYRRVYTVPLTAIPRPAPGDVSGDYEAAAYATVACTDGYPWHNPHNPKDFDVGHAYLGGWSTTPEAPGGNVDAGLQYDWKQHKNSQDDYGPFLNIAGLKYWTLNKPAKVGQWSGHTGRVGCSDADFVIIGFEVHPITDPPCTYLKCVGGGYELILDVESAANGNIATLIWEAPGIPAPGPLYGGWGDVYAYSGGGCTTTCYNSEVPCGGCIFKYMSSIAQLPPGNYTDKSRYSVTWFQRTVSCWETQSCPQNSEPLIPLTSKLVYCTEYPMWGATYNHGNRDCTNTPKSLKGVEKSVGVSGYSPTGETDAISLTY